MRIYWFAPFNNANELDLAAQLPRPSDHLLVQSLRTRFGKALPIRADGFELVRDLPEPAGDDGGRRWIGSRAMTTIRCARSRERLLASRPRFDLFHLHTINTFTDGIAVRALTRHETPIVLSVHNVREHQRRLPTSVETALLRSAYNAADAVIVAHTILRDQLITEFTVPSDRIHVIPLVIPKVELGNPGSMNNGSVPLCLFFGTFRANKGIPVLLKAIESAGSDIEARFHFAGRGERDLERLVLKAAEADPRITAEVGYVPTDRLAELYRSASLILMPYTWFSAQSGVLREAYAFRKPVIVSDVGALGRAVQEDASGWVTPPGDVEALAHAIREALTDDQRRRVAVEQMQQIASQRGPEDIARSMRELYDQTVRFAPVT